jgi:hypothetical protein
VIGDPGHPDLLRAVDRDALDAHNGAPSKVLTGDLLAQLGGQFARSLDQALAGIFHRLDAATQIETGRLDGFSLKNLPPHSRRPRSRGRGVKELQERIDKQ